MSDGKSSGERQGLLSGISAGGGVCQGICGKICREQGVEPLFPSEGEIELTKRNGRSGEIWFALNHGKKPGYVDLGEKTYQDLLTGKRCTGKLVLESRDVAVLKREQ